MLSSGIAYARGGFVNMRWMWSALAAGVVSISLTLPAFAQSSDDAADLSKLQPRSDRLDIFGAGMCHQCEWRPRAKMMAALEQCGADSDGKVRVGVFECGRTPQCDPVCNFISCEAP